MSHPPRMLTTRETATLLAVSPRTVLKWIERDTVPYITLPNDGTRRTQYRIPLEALLETLQGNYTWDPDVLAAMRLPPEILDVDGDDDTQ